MRKSRLVILLGPLSFIGLAACGTADDPQAQSNTSVTDALSDRGARMAIACSGCHSGEAGAIVSLRTYSEAMLLESLSAYQSDPAGTTVMHRLARGYTDEDIQLVSAYLGQQEDL